MHDLMSCGAKEYNNIKVLLILMIKEEKDEHLQVMASVPLTLA